MNGVSKAKAWMWQEEQRVRMQRWGCMKKEESLRDKIVKALGRSRDAE